MDDWYSLASDGELRQGEILLSVPIYFPTADLERPVEGGEQNAIATIVDVIVITPSCDLLRKPLVVLCEHWDLKEQIKAGKLPEGAVAEIEKGRRPLNYILPASPIPEVPMAPRVVDFSRISSLPRNVVMAHAQAQRHRLRLRPPFCEHFAQAFARCYMRIGLPSSAMEYSKAVTDAASNRADPAPLPTELEQRPRS